jgi:cell wall-associated NlpC family hydrolase
MQRDMAASPSRRYIVRVLSRCGFLTALLGSLLAGACASTGAVPAPFPRPAEASPSPAAAPSSAAPAPPAAPALDGYSIAGTALTLRGTPYRDGGGDPSGFDCSGFVWYVFGQHGVKVPRTVGDQYRAGRGVPADHIEPGDLVFFTTVAAGASHVGIAIGGDQFVHAPSGRGQVRVERLSAAYWANRFVGARRVTPRGAAPSS